MTTALSEISKQEVQQKSIELSSAIRSINVQDNSSRARMIEMLQVVKAFRNDLAVKRKERIKEADQLHKNLLADYKKEDAPFEQLESYGKAQVNAWDREQERKQAEVEAKLREAARKQEEEARLQYAEILEQEGQQDRAMELINEAPKPIAYVAPKLVEKVAGSSSKTLWHADFPDIKKIEAGDKEHIQRMKDLVRAVHEGKAPILSLMPNGPFLNKQANSFKGLLEIPGVHAVDEKNLSIKAAQQ